MFCLNNSRLGYAVKLPFHRKGPQRVPDNVNIVIAWRIIMIGLALSHT